MKINAVSNAISSFVKKNNGVSFKSIYIEDSVNLGQVSEHNNKSKFLKKDALLLNKIAQLYPNQDCFIRSGFGNFPRLEFREKPPEVQTFGTNLFKQYNISINPDDMDYPTEPLLLYGNDNLARMIGMTSFISLNPSLPYTVQAGYELHKKLIEKKKQIMEEVGKTDGITLGEKTLIKRAHEGIKETEEALKRYLMESSYEALSKRASAKQIYASAYPKVQSRLDRERSVDLTTSLAKLNDIQRQIINGEIQPDETYKEGIDISKIDICEAVMKKFPNYSKNVERNKFLQSEMSNKGMIIS